MKRLTILWTLLALVSSWNDPAAAQQARLRQRVPSIPERPLELVAAQPYTLTTPLTFHVDGSNLKIDEGWVLVLKADLSLLRPVNAADYVVMASNSVAHRVNSGYRDGHLIVVVPKVDLELDRIFFGSRLVPEQMTQEDFRREERAAIEKKIAPFSKKEVAAARKLGGETIVAKNFNELWYETKPLILRYAPAEREMAESLRK